MKKTIPLLIALSLILFSAGGKKKIVEPQCFDPWINGMCWSFPSTIEKKTGKLKWTKHDKIPESEFETVIAFYNQSRTEIIMFYAANGRMVGEDWSSSVKIFHNIYPIDTSIRTLRINRFTTGKGIRLGMNITEVERILGKECMDPNKFTNEEGTWLSYNISSFGDPVPSLGEVEIKGECRGKKYSKILEEYNMIVYNSSYLFKDGVLSKIGLSDYP